ncbi:DMT family transporter [Isoalcanivorax beigongshangi]|uniref:DMT family transporter n=1 Tax=Isoalcanivorax beigongshangi TaxID=3238810 RepID=A0ABV4AHT8_9GAMM
MATVLSYLMVILVWTTTPLTIKWSAEAGAPLGALMLRMALAAVLCAGLLWLRGGRLDWSRRATLGYVAALPGIFVSMMLSYLAARQLPSGLISVMFGLAPLLSGILLQCLPGSVRLQWPHWLACVLGFCGLALVFHDSLRADAALLVPLLMMLASVTCFAASAIAVQRVGSGQPPLNQTFGSLVLAAPLFMLVWWVSGEPLSIPLTVRGSWSVLYLAVIGSLVGLLCYYFILTRLSVATVSLVTFITPVLAVAVGVAFNNEQFGSGLWGGVALILLSLATYLLGDLRRRRRHRAALAG